VGTAAPKIVADLRGSDFSWVRSAYTLSSAAFLPFSGNLASIFGRRRITMAAVLLFAVGSAICGAASTMTVLIVERVRHALQGIGGGGLQALVYIITADLVPLRERGLFTGITGWCVTDACVIQFNTSMLFQKRMDTRKLDWAVYLNLPLCVLSFVAVALFLDLKTPEGRIAIKLLLLIGCEPWVSLKFRRFIQAPSGNALISRRPHRA
ncbi:major facilitator superfamily domain-containing protein, partial [Mycena vulgaris]